MIKVYEHALQGTRNNLSTLTSHLPHLTQLRHTPEIAKMSAPRAGYHQDYIARIRHSNALPPPPLPPKLLDIPNTGLASGQYTAGNYAARLAREQPLNVDADAFGGMEINLVGLKGAFEGDGTSMRTLSQHRFVRANAWNQGLYFEEHPPPIDPADRPLLRPLATIGKPVAISAGVAFLRRTEYISQSGAKRSDSNNAALRAPPSRPKPRPDVNKDDPINILRSIVKGFDIAYPSDAYTGADSSTNLKGAQAAPAEKQSWAKPRHPTRRDLTLLDSYPLLPDFDAIPEEGGYMFYRFQQNPGAAEDEEDETVNVNILRPIGGGNRLELFVPENAESVARIKRKFSATDPSADDDDLYDYSDGEGNRSFRYKRVRIYQNEHSDLRTNMFNDNVALALHDSQGPEHRLKKGAYIYPISGRGRLVAERPKKVSGYVLPDMPEEEKIDFVLATVTDPPEAVRVKIDDHKAVYDPIREE